MSYQTMKAPEQIKSNFVRHKGIRRGDHSNPYRTRDKDESLAVDVCYTAPEEEEATEGEGIGRDYPLETGLRYCESVTDGR